MSDILDLSPRSRTSRHDHYVPRSTYRTPGATLATEPDHPLKVPVDQLCAEIEHLKRENRTLRARLGETQSSSP
jgi:hypothetical protein